jgi:hypothetical protein
MIMNLALAPSARFGFHAGFAELRRTTLSAVAAFVFALLCMILGVLYLPGDWMRPQLDVPVTRPLVLASPADGKTRARTGCVTCGIVEELRPVEAAAGLPARFEFIVRMEDGSRRTSTVGSFGSWRLGDRIMLIGG